MKALIAPGLFLMDRLTTPQRMLLCALAFTLPLAVALYLCIDSAAMSWQDPALVWIGFAYFVAVYSTIGHHVQVRTGFRGLREAIHRFSAGDLDYRDEGTSQGEIGVLLAQTKEMSASLAGIFQQVRSSADAINQAA